MGYRYPCFELLVMSPLGFKVRVALFTLGRGIHDVYSLNFTSGVTPADLLMASKVASNFPHMYVSAELGCQI